MPIFRYEVVDQKGKKLIGAMSANTDVDVHHRLVEKGYTVVNVVPTGEVTPTPQAATASTAQPARRSRANAPKKELAVFFRTLASFLRAGMSTFEALNHTATQTSNRGMVSIAGRLSELVQSGETLSSSMEEFPHAFPPNVIGVIRASEVGGFLAIVMEDIALDYELASRASAGKIRWLAGGLWINGIGTILVAPLFSIGTQNFLDAMKPGGSLNFAAIARNYLSWTGVHLVLPMAIIYLIYLLTVYTMRQPSMRYTAHRMLLRMPLGYGRASRERSLASFTRILWRLQNAGVLPIKSWDAASYAAENVYVAAQLHDQLDGIRSGMKFSEALAASGLFTSDDLRQVSIGEASGLVPDALQRTAAYYEDAANTTAGRTKWYGVRLAGIVNIIAIGVVAYCMEILPLTMATDSLFQ
jgi:type IV pilus assembly protein PilC